MNKNKSDELLNNAEKSLGCLDALITKKITLRDIVELIDLNTFSEIKVFVGCNKDDSKQVIYSTVGRITWKDMDTYGGCRVNKIVPLFCTEIYIDEV